MYSTAARALNRVARDAEFLGDCVGGAESDAVNRACEHVGIALHHVKGVLAVKLVDSSRVRGGQTVPAQKYGELAQTRGVAPCSRDQSRGRGADARNFAHAFGGVVEHFAERVAEMFGDSAREPGADALYFRSQVAFDRDGAGGADGFEVDDVELLTEARMLFEGAESADGRADFEACEIADDGDTAKIAMLLRDDDNRDRRDRGLPPELPPR